jgi:hypothetical protein
MTLGKATVSATGVCVWLLALVLQGCLSKISVLQSPDGGVPGTGQGGTAGQVPHGGPGSAGSGSENGSSGAQAQPHPPPQTCVNGWLCEFVDASANDKLDLLFVVDNTASMADEQASLVAQFPKLVSVLTSGNHYPGDTAPFPPVKDLHVGVVSTDLGAPAVIGLDGCDANGGDDGRLQDVPHGLGCDAAYPTFLTYSSPLGISLIKFADDMGCVARLGTGGCRFTQQLEAPLKALWPTYFKDSEGNVITPNPLSFLSTTVEGTMGRGDLPRAQGGNAGFLRNDENTGLSVIAIVVVTDKDDCSFRSTELTKPQGQLPPDSALYNQPLDLRCFYNKSALYDVVNRYARGFRLLRQGKEQLVIFAAIAGVPADLVDASARAGVDFSNTADRDAYYRRVLTDVRMQETLDQASQPADPASPPGATRLTPSCARTDVQGQLSVAYPPRRLVELASAMGDNGVVQSICQDDLGMDLVIDTISRRLGGGCLTTPLLRSAKRTVACDVIWELPPPNSAPASTPTECTQVGYAAFLKPVASPRKATNDRTGKNCIVTQLAVQDLTPFGGPPAGEGWFYDDFTDELSRQCRTTSPQRIAFTAGAKPPTGVQVVLDCKASARAQ